MSIVTTWLPLALICGYRRIPCRVRRMWSMGSSSSGTALAMIGAGAAPWAAFRACTAGWRLLPAYALARIGIVHADEEFGWLRNI